ncbi:MAG: PAS domain-containing protein [Bacteroidetes bacterium]|nr:PAS domain-containing protein [Bacteroidota bacterium]
MMGPEDLKYKDLFRQLPGLFLILKPSLEIADASDAYLAATLTKRNEIVGRSIFDVFPDNPNEKDANGVRNLHQSLMRVLTEKLTDAMAVQKYDIPRPASEGGGFEERYWSPVNAPLFNSQGEIEYIVHRAEDVTEFVRAQKKGEEEDSLSNRLFQMEVDIIQRSQELQESNLRLREIEKQLDLKNRLLFEANEEMVALNEELTSSNEELRITNEQLEANSQKLKELLDQQIELVDTKSRIVSIASHELRTPISVISISAGFIKKYKEKMTGEEIDVKLENINRQVNNISALLSDILTLGKSESNTLKVIRREMNLPEFFSRLKNDIESSTRNTHAVVLELDIPNTIINDDGLMRNIFSNLLSNSIKYSPNSKEVVLKAFVNDGFLTTHIIDHGIGIPESQLKDLFTPWFRASNSSGFVGHGLGLSIVKKAIELLKGDISVKSAPGLTQFTVNIPLQD